MAQLGPQPAGVIADVLHMLPLDVVEASVWKVVAADGRSHLRQTCRQLRQLSDHLITAAVHDLHYGNAGSRTAFRDSNEEQPASKAQWRRAVAARSAFLGGLPHLAGLTLQRWSSEEDLASALLGYSPALRLRMTTLTLTAGVTPALGHSTLSVTSTLAARLACPNLRTLRIRQYDKHHSLVLQGGLFQPFYESSLQSLDIDVGVTLFNDVLRSVGCLSRLQHLSLTLHNNRPAQLQPLSHLTNLRSLALCLRYGGDGSALRQHSLADMSALLSLTRLEELRLRNVVCPATAAEEDTDGAGAGAAVHAAHALLGGLLHLTCLQLSDACVIGDTTFAALCHLTGLTALHVAGLALASPHAPGQLQQLQRVGQAAAPLPSVLLRSLLPLLPLPCLRHLVSLDVCGTPLCLCLPKPRKPTTAAARQFAALVAAELDALRQAAMHLAAAPRLRLRAALIHCFSRKGHPSLSRLAHSLQPLAGCLHHLILSGWGLQGADWGALAGTLPGVTSLNLSTCSLPGGTLKAVALALPALRLLLVHECVNVGVKGWLGLAATCRRPLGVDVDPVLDPEVVAQFRRVAQREHGAQYVFFGREAPQQ